MQHSDIQSIAIIYGKKELIEEFIEKFNIDRKHDGAKIKARLLERNSKEEIKKFIWKGD